MISKTKKIKTGILLIAVCLIAAGSFAAINFTAGGKNTLATVFAAETGGVAQLSSLNGTVVPEGLIAPGTTVKEGQVLVMVKTFAGNAPAARASIDGKVVEVNVMPGNEITAGQVVAKIKPF